MMEVNLMVGEYYSKNGLFWVIKKNVLFIRIFF